MSQELSLPAVIGVIRRCQGFSERDTIVPDMRLERDCGITGDDGWELFEELEHQFAVALFDEKYSIWNALHLKPNQTFFHGEVFVPWLAFIRRLLGKQEYEVRDITVGELHDALAELKRKQIHD